MVGCAVKNCRNYSTMKNPPSKIRYFRFPHNETVLNAWIKACGPRKEFSVKSSRICSDHFTESDWRIKDMLLNTPYSQRRLKVGAVPTVNLNLQPSESKHKRKKRFFGIIPCEFQDSENIGQSEVEISENNFKVENNQKEEEYMEVSVLRNAFQTRKTKANKAVQTWSEEDRSRELEITRLRQELDHAKKDLKKCKTKLAEYQHLEYSMSQCLTAGQIKRLKFPNRTPIWLTEDISSAFSLYATSRRAYMLLQNRNFPLPATSTLRRWAAKVKLTPGILGSVINVLRSNNYEEKERIVVLLIGKIQIKRGFKHLKVNETASSPKKYARVIMMRSFVGNWKHIIYYDFDFPVTTTTLISCIEDLNLIGFKVVAVVSEIGPNVALWRDLHICEEQPFVEMVDGRKVFFFINPQYLIQLMRKHFLENGFTIDYNVVNSDCIQELVQLERDGDTLTAVHLELNVPHRQKLELALQLFSHTVADSIRNEVCMGRICASNALDCSDMLQLIAAWYDLFNSDTQYELFLAKQETIISEMTTRMREIRIRGTKKPFQEAILLNNASLPQLFNYLWDTYSICSLETNRLNLCELEVFFGGLKSTSRVNNHPTPLEFKSRLRAWIIGNLSKFI